MSENVPLKIKPAEPVFQSKTSMTARDLFGLILRSVALWLTIWGAWNTIAGLKYLSASMSAVASNPDVSGHTATYLMFGLPAMLGGILVLRCANAILRFTYRSETGSSSYSRRRGI